MKKNILKSLSRLLLCSTALLASSQGAVVAAGSYYDSQYYVNVQNMRVYQDPDSRSKAFGGLAIGHQLRKVPAPRKAPAGWLYVEYHLAGKSGNYVGWVRKDSVVRHSAFKRVTQGWPIRYYCYWRFDVPTKGKDKDDDAFFSAITGGTKTFEATFERNGSARVSEFDDSVDWYGMTQGTSAKSGRQTHRGWIYRAGNVVMLKYGKDASVGFTYGLDAAKSRLYGGESPGVSGQGTPNSRSQKAYVTQYVFGEAVRLSADAAKYCKNAPGK